MSTIQKAFVFIVLIMAVLAATVQLVLFAQRDNWSARYEESEGQVKQLTSDLNKAKGELAQVTSDKSTAVADLESQLASTQNGLADARRELESTMADKDNLTSLVSTATVKLESLDQSMAALASRNVELAAGKQAAEEELAEVKAARQDAQEQLALASRKVRDLDQKVTSLDEEVSERSDRIRKLEQQVAVLSQYYPGAAVDVSAPTQIEVLGKITEIASDRSTVYLSIGSEDGVENGMLLMIFKTDGTYVSDGKVFNVSGSKSAAKILKPVYGTVTEGDYVANK